MTTAAPGVKTDKYRYPKTTATTTTTTITYLSAVMKYFCFVITHHLGDWVKNIEKYKPVVLMCVSLSEL